METMDGVSDKLDHYNKYGKFPIAPEGRISNAPQCAPPAHQLRTTYGRVASIARQMRANVPELFQLHSSCAQLCAPSA